MTYESPRVVDREPLVGLLIYKDIGGGMGSPEFEYPS